MHEETTPCDESSQLDDRESFPAIIDDCVVLTGPTASGKSSVAISLANRIDGEIISLDSIAVYRMMDIGTAKPSLAEQQAVPHHMIDVVDACDEYSVAMYLKAAHGIVKEIRDRGRKAIFVGGTPMFLKGVLRGFDPGPPADWEFRQAVESDVEKHGAEALRRRLEQVDPLAAHRIDPNDVRRMIRALEVARSTGVPMSHRQIQFDRQRSADSCHVFAMAWPRAELHDRINERVKRMFDDGLVDEVKGLLDKFGTLSRTAAQAVGYREVITYLNDDGDLDQTVEEVSAHTRQLARRQETWFRSFSEIEPVEIQEPIDAEAVADKIASRIEAKS